MSRIPPLGLLLLCSTCFAFGPTLHLPFDGDVAGSPGAKPLSTSGPFSFAAGKSGQAISLPAGSFLTFPSKGLLDKTHGAVACWVKPNWDGDDGKNHALLADASDFNDKLQNTLYLWKWSTGQLRLDLRSPADPYLTVDVSHWKAGEWHHIGASWDAATGLALFVDGQCVVRREATYEPHSWPTFNIGGDWSGQGTGDAVFDDLRLYDMPLEAAHMAALMQGLPLEQLAVTKVTAPKTVRIGTPFSLQVEAQALQPLTRDYPLLVLVDGVEIARLSAEPPAAKWDANKPLGLRPVSAAIPTYLRVRPGSHTLTVQFEGAVAGPSAPAAVASIHVQPAVTTRVGHTYTVTADGQPRRDGKPFPPAVQGEGFLYDGVFYVNDEEGRAKACALIRSGMMHDAIPCRLLDIVDCGTQDHHFREWGASTVAELLPGQRFRITGAPDTVEQQVNVYGTMRRCLPGFAYTLANTPLPKMHVLVAELPNDRERYTEIAIDAAAGSQLAPHLASGGSGDTRLINLSTVYTGREYPCDRSTLRHCMVFYPKSNACEVTVTSSGRDRTGSPDAGAAVSRLSVFEVMDDEAALYNPIPLPDKQPSRSVSLFFPEHSFLYTQWGFSGVGEQQRRASLLSLFDYMKFMGMNRLEFHPVSFGMKCFYNGGALPNGAKYDVFDDLLPLAEERGMQIIPALDGMAFYDQFADFTADSFQLDRDGKSVRKYFGKVPDPLRPEVQAHLRGFMSEFLERTLHSKAVPMVAFKVDGKMGTCYSGDSPGHPAEDAGYSEWDIAQFEKAVGVTVGGTAGDTPSRHEWLRAQPDRWTQWMDWRCQATRDFWLKTRDLVTSRGKEDLLVKTILPDNFPGYFNFWQERGRSPLEVVRGHGYDPRLYTQEKGLRFTRCLLVGADRYFGQEANKTWQYDEAQADFYQTAEGTETELYFVYWELPQHPKGFRVGPSAGPGRAFFEPLTYTLRVHNPVNLTLYNWYAGSIGHELDLRRFIRAYRALPAVPPRDFEGEIYPRDPRLCARWYGERLAVINDTGQARRIRVTFPEVFPMGTVVTDIGSGLTMSDFPGKNRTRLDLHLEAWDVAALEIVKPTSSKTRGFEGK
ncbi:LamG domain-containing protein [bacterium]|nr:LamG domain-containing protein [bacterium]